MRASAAVTAFLYAMSFAACERRSGVAYENGLWFDGDGFSEQTWYEIDGALTSVRPSRVDSMIDLQGGYVVPPFAEGHNHILEIDHVEQYVRMYMNQGIFYIKDQSNTLHSRAAVSERMNQPDSPDFVSATHGLTGPGGHPIQILLQLQRLGSFPAEWTPAEFDGDGVLIVESEADVEAKWPLLAAARPDFVKVFLLYSGVHEDRANDPEYRFRRGIDPALVPGIVRRAHGAGLMVSAHIYSAEDFRTAVRSGVDQISHMPGLGYEEALGAERFLLDDSDAELAAENGITVLTTLTGLARELEAPESRLHTIVVPNLRRLRAAGVPILIGSDQFRGTSRSEAEFLALLGEFSNLELLRMWSVDTPRMIFPERAIGRFQDEYEASFLVLARNPLEDFSATREIQRRVKQGHLVRERPVEFPRIPGQQ